MTRANPAREAANIVSSGGTDHPAHNIGTSGDDDATTYESGPNHEEHT